MNFSKLHIVLGSSSPRRKQLLELLGLEIEVRVVPTEENFPANLKRAEVAVYLAVEKAKAFADTLKKNELLITADTIVCYGEEILNKPADSIEAFNMLRLLSGKSHQVYTGVALGLDNLRKSFYVESTVLFRNLSDNEINEYVNNFKPYDKAGSYGAQECLEEGMNPCSQIEKEFMKRIGKPDLFKQILQQSARTQIPIIQTIEGSFFNVMGLPIVELWTELEKLNFSE